MPTREAIRSLGREIIGSYEARRERVAQIEREARGQLQRSHQAHQAMARGQRTALQRGRAQLAGEVKSQVKQIGQTRQAMARGQRAALAEERAALGGRVREEIQEIGETRRAAAQRQRTALHRGRAQLAGEVKSQVKQIGQARQAAARSQRTALARERASLVPAEKRRQSQVNAWLRGVATERAGGQKEWQGLVATMRSKRHGGGVPIAAPAGEEESAPLAQRVFHYLASHPDGNRLGELEQELGVGRFQMVRALKALTDEGKVEKRELQYFAV